MKKLYSLSVAFLLVLSNFGCSKKIIEEEIIIERPEMVDDVMELESYNVNIRDSEKVYRYYTKNVNYITKNEFLKNFTPYYFDITADGTDDVCYVINRIKDNFICYTAYSARLEEISTDDLLVSEVTNITIDGNFVIIEGKQYETFFDYNVITIAYFNGKRIKNILSDLKMYVSDDKNYLGVGEIVLNDGYKDFNYIYNQYFIDQDNNKIHEIKKQQNYKIDFNTLSYVMSKVDENFNNSNNKVNSFDNYYDLNSIMDGNEINNLLIEEITYKKEKEVSFILSGEIELVGKVIYSKWNETYNVDVLEYKTPFELPIIFNLIPDITTVYETPKQLTIVNSRYLESLLSIDELQKLKEEETVILDLKVNLIGYNGRYLYKELNICTIEDAKFNNDYEDIDLKLIGFQPETINNTYINYSEYLAVLVPMNDTKNSYKLTRLSYNFIDSKNKSKVSFKLFGKMFDVKYTYTDSLDSKPIVKYIGNLENTLVEIYAPFSNDFSNIVIEGKVNIGSKYYETIKFKLDNKTDYKDYEIIAISK